MIAGNPACTVVVCTRDRLGELDECLTALAQQDHPSFEVLVIDNSPETSAEGVCRQHGVLYDVEPVVGLSRARNRGARAAHGDIIAYTDDDAVPEPGWLSALAAEFSDPLVMAAAGRVCYRSRGADGTRLGGPEQPGNWHARPRRVFSQKTPGWVGIACFGGIGDGNNMAFRRSLFDHRDVFDERLGRGAGIRGGEEHFAWANVIGRGHQVAYAPDAVVNHPIPATPIERRARRAAELRTLCLYLGFLWRELPSHRREIARYFLSSPRRMLRRLFTTPLRERKAQ